MYYFDYAATTMMDDEVVKTLLKTNENYFAHPDNDYKSIALEKMASDSILKYFGINNYDLIFTPSATIANNLCVNAVFDLYLSKKHFITTCYEHNSMLKSFERLTKKGVDVTYIKPDSNGIINKKDVISAIKDNTAFISIMHVNNELGSVNDINDIFKDVKQINNSIITMSDMVQTLSKVSMPSMQYVDMFSISAHKIYGPKGVGALIYKNTIKISDTAYYRYFDATHKGTQPIYNKVAFAKAIKLVFDNYDNNLEVVNNNIKYLKQQLSAIDFVNFNVDSNSNILSIHLNKQMLGESLVKLFYDNNFKISSRSSCSSKSKTISASLSAIGLSHDNADRTIRISISHKTNIHEIDKLVSFIKTL